MARLRRHWLRKPPEGAVKLLEWRTARGFEDRQVRRWIEAGRLNVVFVPRGPACAGVWVPIGVEEPTRLRKPRNHEAWEAKKVGIAARKAAKLDALIGDWWYDDVYRGVPDYWSKAPVSVPGVNQSVDDPEDE